MDGDAIDNLVHRMFARHALGDDLHLKPGSRQMDGETTRVCFDASHHRHIVGRHQQHAGEIHHPSTVRLRKAQYASRARSYADFP